MKTVPSSSMSICAPVLFLKLLDVLAAGADQLADLFRVDLHRQQARCVLADLGARAGQDGGHLIEDRQPGFFGAMQRLADDLVVDAFGFDVELDGGDAVAGAADFEIHVAEMIFLADDVGEEGGAIAFLNQADGDSGDGLGDRHAGVHQGEASAATAGHGAGAVGFEDVADDADGVGEFIDAGQHGDQAALGEGAVADFAAARAADGANFAHAVAGEVVMQHEFLAVFVDEAIDHLLIAAGAEGDGAHRLRFAAGEDGRAVNAGQHADLAGDRADAVIIAAIGANAGENRLAGHLLFDFDEDRANLLLLILRSDDRLIAGVRIGDRRGHLGHQIVEDLLDRIGAIGLAGFAFDFANLVGDAGADGIDEAGIGMLDLADLGLAGLLLQLFDHADDFDDGLVAEFDGIGDVVFLHLAAAEFDHVDEMLGAGDDQIKIAVFKLLDGGIQDELSFDPADADVGRRGE